MKTLLLVSSSVRSKQLLCFVYGQDKKKFEIKHTKKTLLSFITIIVGGLTVFGNRALTLAL